MVIHESKRLLILSLSIFILLLGIGLGYLYLSNKLNSDDAVIVNSLLTDEGPCSIREQDSLLSQSVNVFLPAATDTNQVASERTEKLFALEEKIIQEENYEKDANCLHVLTMLYISRGDTANAEKHLSLLEEGLKISSPESYLLDENVNFWTLEQMHEFINSAKDAEQQRIENDPLKGQSRLDEKIE